VRCSLAGTGQNLWRRHAARAYLGAFVYSPSTARVSSMALGSTGSCRVDHRTDTELNGLISDSQQSCCSAALMYRSIFVIGVNNVTLSLLVTTLAFQIGEITERRTEIRRRCQPGRMQRLGQACVRAGVPQKCGYRVQVCSRRCRLLLHRASAMECRCMVLILRFWQITRVVRQ
jgi:hypothetical protein